MYFFIETRQYGYLFPLSRYRVTFWHESICVYEDGSSDPQPCLTFDLRDVEKFSLREDGEF